MAFGDPDAEGGDQATGGGGGGYAAEVSANIGSTMAQAKAATTNYNAPPATQSIDHWDTQDKESDAYSPPAALSAVNKGFTVGDESTYAAYEDAKAYSDKGWAPGQALTFEDEQGKTQLATLEAHENALSPEESALLRQKAYAAALAPKQNSLFGIDFSIEGMAKQAIIGSNPVGALGLGITSLISQPYSEKFSGTAAQRAALGYYGPGFPTGMTNIGPFMETDDYNWEDARWGDDFDPEKGARVDSQGNIVSDPTSPAGGEVITVAAPAGAPDARVAQFKALYPEDWTETLTDEEIIEMVENPDQLRFWLSWRQT